MSDTVIEATVTGPSNPMDVPQEMREYGEDEQDALDRLKSRIEKHIDIFGTDTLEDIDIDYEVIH